MFEIRDCIIGLENRLIKKLKNIYKAKVHIGLNKRGEKKGFREYDFFK